MSSQIKPIKVWSQGGVKAVSIRTKSSSSWRSSAFPTKQSPSCSRTSRSLQSTSPSTPNGRYHSLESGAIVEYLIEAYDTDHRLRFAPEHQNRIMRNSGSTFRQQDKVRTWAGGLGELKLYHSEQVYSAIERYIKEVNRVTGILDVYLAQTTET
ncbi:hypothetical protein V1520DRAFT_329541 [Lipomyces starkeyi]